MTVLIAATYQPNWQNVETGATIICLLILGSFIVLYLKSKLHM